MLINFALDVIGTKITSDKVSTDGYECSNLTSSNWHLRRKGFLAEHFIKPPVSLTFQFPCNVCIHHIFVTPCVGQQISSHLELFSASKFMHRREMQGSLASNVESTKRKGLSNPSDISHSLLPGFYPISKIYTSSNDRICFYNPMVSSSLNNGTAYDNSNNTILDHHRAEMRHFRQELISASSHLTLRIVRTVSGSTSAVSSIDIWGLPAMSVPTIIKDDIVNKYTSFINQSFAVKNSETLNHDKNVSSSTALASTNYVIEDHELEVPDDFIDPITCEVMAIPMLLPSGKNVDLSTLDHYFNVEASYGRQPRDPFTGLQFSNTVKPIPNGALKTRIDKFLLEHCDDPATSSVARTVRTGTNVSLLGKRKNSGNAIDGVSLLISHSLDRRHVHSTNQDQTKVNILEVFPSQNSKHGSQQSQPLSQLSNHNKSENVHCTEVSHKLHRSQQTLYSNKCSGNDCTDNSHETQLKSSLNDALSSVLNSLPSYLSNSQSPTDNNICFSCQGPLTADKTSYVTPCHHFICRECLASNNFNSSVTCGVCGHIFTANSVIRKHQVI